MASILRGNVSHMMELARNQRALCKQLHPSGSKGMWTQQNPLDYPYPLMMAQIILIVVTSRLLYAFLRPLGQTKFVCNLMGGIIWGPSILGQNQAIKDQLLYEGKEFPLFDTIAVMGTVYSMFIISVKTDLSLLRRNAETACKIGLPCLILPLAASLTLRQLFKKIPGMNGIGFFGPYSSFTLSSSFFPVIAQALDELNLMTSELGQIAMSCGMLNDVLAWSAMTITFLVQERFSINGLEALVSFFFLVCFIFYFVRPLLQLIANETKATEGHEVKEYYVVAIQLLVLVLAFVSDAIGTRATAGPIILGLVMPHGPPLGATIVNKTEFFVSEFLMPVFFFRVGFHINVYTLYKWSSVVKLEIFLLVTYAAKIVAIMVVGALCKMKLKNNLILGLIMSIKGIVELMDYNRWRTKKAINVECFTQMVLSAMVLTMIATALVHFLYKPKLREGESVKNMQSVARDSEMLGILFCVHNEESVRNIIFLLEASNPTEASPICAYVIHTVELMGRLAPLLVPVTKQRTPLRRTNSPTYHMMQALENYSKDYSKGPVLIQAYTMMAPYRSMHDPICRLASDNLIPLIIIPFHENHQSMVGPSAMSAEIRHFNVNVQTYSPCTVGILVDRDLSCRLSLGTKFSCNVGVFFIGGPDDREALAYAGRMSGNPEVVMMVFRFTLRNKTKGNEEEAKLDKELVDKFKLRNKRNPSLDWRDIEVEDGVQVVDEIRKLQGNYDLVMVGRRHNEVSLRDEEMADFVENAELGVVGDMLASLDFCGGMTNVLVIQDSIYVSCEASHDASISG